MAGAAKRSATLSGASSIRHGSAGGPGTRRHHYACFGAKPRGDSPFRGLPFTRWDDGRIFFDVHGLWQQPDLRTELPLKQLVLNLQNFRSPLASDTSHPLCRGQSDCWLQTIVAQDISRVDACLHPDHLYEQVFAQAGSPRGIPDLLEVTPTGRLATLELKTSENLELPRQAGDYWSRIRRHQHAGDLARYGYFSGVALQSTPPLVYLISPALRFHQTTDTLWRFLSPEMEVIRMAWRRPGAAAYASGCANKNFVNSLSSGKSPLHIQS